MADLSTLSATDPADGEAVSNGASRIRAVADATKTSFDLEHALAGAHSFLNGAPGARPAAGTDGRIFFDTTNKRIERDTGSAWSILNAVQAEYAYTAAVTSTGTSTSYLTMQTVSIDVPTGGRLLAIGWADYAPGVNPLVVATQMQIDGVAITGSGGLTQLAAEQQIVSLGYSASPTAGTRSVTMKATTTTSAAASVTLRALLVLVF